CAYACLGSVFLYLGAVGDPVAVGDLADHETAVAQMSKFHDGHSNGDGHAQVVRRNGIEVNKVCTGALPRCHGEGPVCTPALLMGGVLRVCGSSSGQAKRRGVGSSPTLTTGLGSRRRRNCS